MRRITTKLQDIVNGFFNYIKDGTISLDVVKYVMEQIPILFGPAEEQKIKNGQSVALTITIPNSILPTPLPNHLIPVTLEFDGKHHLMFDHNIFNVISRGNRYWKSVTLPPDTVPPQKTYEVTVVLVDDKEVENAIRIISIFPGPDAKPEPDNIRNWQGLTPPVSLAESEKFWLTPEDISERRTQFDTEKWAIIYNPYKETYEKNNIPKYAVIELEKIAEEYIKIKKSISNYLSKLPKNSFEVLGDEKSLFSIISKLLLKMKDKSFSEIKETPIQEILGDIIRFTIFIKNKALYSKNIEKLKKYLKHLAYTLNGVVEFEKKEASIDSPYGSSIYIDIVHADFILPNGIKVEIQIYPKSYLTYKEESHKKYDLDKERKKRGIEPEKDPILFQTIQAPLHRTRTMKGKKIVRRDIRPQIDERRDIIERRRTAKSVQYIFKMASLFYKLSRLKKDGSTEFLVMVKPNGLPHIQKVVELIQNHGGQIVDSKKVNVDSRLISQHYRQFADKSFFPPMIKYYTGRDVVLFKVRGTDETIANLRLAIGDAKPVDPETFRFQITGETWKNTLKEFGVIDNGIHISDSVSEGQREVDVWFGD
jgi:nucleoside diphosphate kinase